MALPEDLSFDLYVAFEQQPKLSKIVELFERAGWETRDCSWTEYEIQGDDVDLTLIPSSPPLLSGGVLDGTTTVDRVLAVLDAACLAYTYEVFDSGDSLCRSGSS